MRVRASLAEKDGNQAPSGIHQGWWAPITRPTSSAYAQLASLTHTPPLTPSLWTCSATLSRSCAPPSVSKVPCEGLVSSMMGPVPTPGSQALAWLRHAPWATWDRPGHAGWLLASSTRTRSRQGMGGWHSWRHGVRASTWTVPPHTHTHTRTHHSPASLLRPRQRRHPPSLSNYTTATPDGAGGAAIKLLFLLPMVVAYRGCCHQADVLTADGGCDRYSQ